MNANAEGANGQGGFSRFLTAANVVYVASAAVIIFVIVSIITDPRATQVPIPEYWIPSGSHGLDFDGSAPWMDKLRRGIAAYEENDLPGAIELFERAAARGSYDQLRNVYLASALTLSEEYTKALDVFATMKMPRLPPSMRPRARWIRHIALTGAGRHDEAVVILKDLADRDNRIGALARERLELLGEG